MKKLVRKTKHLLIRPMTATDYSSWRKTQETTLPLKNRWDRHLKSESELSRIQFRKLLASQKRLRTADKFYDLGVFERSSGQFVGNVAAMDLVRGLGQTAFIGYRINNRFWGMGYGKEATLAIIDISFRDLKLHRIEAGIEPTNRRSIMLARSIGLRKEGLKKRAVYLRDTWVDLAMYSATCEEFGVKWKGAPPTRPQ